MLTLRGAITGSFTLCDPFGLSFDLRTGAASMASSIDVLIGLVSIGSDNNGRNKEKEMVLPRIGGCLRSKNVPYVRRVLTRGGNSKY